MLRYNENFKKLARQLRKKMTDSEKVLWSRLRGKQLLGVPFYRQKPIGGYVVDFYAPRTKLVVEIDGAQHLRDEALKRDRKRDQYLAGLGLEVMRFNSREVITDTDGVVKAIYRKMRAMLPDY